MSYRHNTDWKRRRGNFSSKNPVGRDKDVWACERAGAGSSEQPGPTDEPLPEAARAAFRGERGQGSRGSLVTAARVTGDSSLSCHGAMATAGMASASKANTPPLIGLVWLLRRGSAEPGLLGSWGHGRLKDKPCLPLQGRFFTSLRFAPSSSYQGYCGGSAWPSSKLRAGSSLGFGCLHSLSEAVLSTWIHSLWGGVGFEGLLLHDPYLPWASMDPVTEIRKLLKC